jgi:SAM-dependent methyltransferase
LPEYRNEVWSFTSPQGGDGFCPEFFEELAAIEEKNFWFQARNRLILSCFKRFFPDTDSLLEVGCGTGFVLSGIAGKFPGINLVGSEYFAEGLPFARGRVPHATLIQADAREIPYVEEFGVVCAFDVLEHIEDDILALTSLYQALRSGGGILLTVPQHQWLWSETDEHACHCRRYTRKELVGKLESAGFTVEYSTSFVALLMPAMFASRFLKRMPSKDPYAELRLSPVLNVLFGMVMDFEKLIIKCGIRLPFGGSLLIVGRKR